MLIRLPKRLRFVAWLLVLSFALMALDVPAYAQQDKHIDIRLSNLDWKREGNVIVITFDLQAQAGEKYKVNLTLLRERDVRFKFTPKTVAGHVGEIVLAGPEGIHSENSLRAVWDYKKDFPPGLYGDDYYFEITVEPVVAGINWFLYVLGGAALVGGGYFAYEKWIKPPPPNELPTPPERP